MTLERNTMNTKKHILIIITILLIGLIITGSSYAFWTWSSNTTKNVVFNTSKKLKDYIIYDEGESKFSGNFQVSDNYTDGIHSTISMYKTSEASDVDLVATIHMDINEIGSNMKTSKALKWVVTEGTSTDAGEVLADGDFIDVNNGDTLTLVPNVEVTTTETFYTIWIWLDESENPDSSLTGETLDTHVWTEINQFEGVEDIYEIKHLNIVAKNISATVIDSKYKIVSYAVTTTNSEPSNWTSIPTDKQSNTYKFSYDVSEIGEHYVWFKDSHNRVKSVVAEIITLDGAPPTGTIATSVSGNILTATANVTDIESGLNGTYSFKVSTSTVCDETVTDFVNLTTSTYQYNISSGNMYYVCVKVEDNAGNSGYIRSDGVSKIIVTFNPNGGTVPLAMKYVAVNRPYGELPTPTKTGYTFKGWTNELYQQVEYIESTGTQYIDTGFVATGGMTVEYTAAYTSGGGYIVGSHNTASPYGRNGGYYNISASKWELGYGDYYPQAGSAITYNQKYDVKFSTIIGNAYLEVNGSRIITNTNNTTISNLNVLVYTNNYSGANSTAKAKIYMLKIYDNTETLVRDFIPVYRVSDNVIGLYDKLNDVFYPNAGTGTFNKGNDVEGIQWGKIITENSNVYGTDSHTLTAIWRDETIPTGTLELSDDNWIITANVTASDTGSGIKENYGYKMSMDSTCDSTTTGFIDVPTDSYTFADGLSYYVCVRIEDNEGNYNYISKRVPNSYFVYTGSEQTYTAEQDGYYFVEAYGAEGGKTTNNVLGGKGAYTSGYIYLNTNDTLYIQVGGSGNANSGNTGGLGGYNGGGAGGNGYSTYIGGAGAGGATDIRLVSGNWNEDTSLNSRIMVAAGGGGAGYDSKLIGGDGGGLIGTSGIIYNGNKIVGGTQTSGYQFGIGMDSSAHTAYYDNGAEGNGGGGGGYYGGLAYNEVGAQKAASGAGGSSFISGFAGVNAITAADDRTHTNNTKHFSNKYFINPSMALKSNVGTGRAKITYVSNLPTRINTDLNNVRYIRDCINGSSANANNNWVEIQAIHNGNNIALGKTVIGTSAEVDNIRVYSYITDGLIDNINNTSGNYSGYGQASLTGLQCVTIDLGQTYNLDEIAVWHYYADGRTYNSNVTYASIDGIQFKKIIDKSQVESSQGKRVTAWDEPLEDENSEIMFTGGYQTYTASENGYYYVEAWGAQGGNSVYNNNGSGAVVQGGAGAYTSGYIYLNQGDNLYLYIGGQGQKGVANTNAAGGYNGGGTGGLSYQGGGGGGGATDVRLVSGAWNDTASLNSRIMVAAGGGGASNYTNAISGGDGGALYGLNGKLNPSSTSHTLATGGTPISGGTAGGSSGNTGMPGEFGIGGNSQSGHGGGGGAGYYGGGGSGYTGGGVSSGAGGSSFISGYSGVNAITAVNDGTHNNTATHYSNKYFVKGLMYAGVNTGNGKVQITKVDGVPTKTNPNLNGVRYIKDCIYGSTVSATNNQWVEIQAINNGINIAKGKPVTTLTDAQPSGTNTDLSIITDGDITSANYIEYDRNINQCVIVDLGQTYNLDEIAVWHVYSDTREYYYADTFVSSDNLFWKNIDLATNVEQGRTARITAWDEPNEGVAKIMYSGAEEKYTATQSGYYKIELKGAEGGYSHGGYLPGVGGETSGYIYLNQGDDIYVYVGGHGNITSNAVNQTSIGGFNGGGDGHNNPSGADRYAGSGGGATDIRYFGSETPSDEDLEWNSTLGLNSRIMVAGGGGGAWYNSTSYNGIGGAGGNLIGGTGTGKQNGSNISITGGTQTSGGTGSIPGGFGIGAGGAASGEFPGGGGGYYGGSNRSFSAGGGSSFISGFAGVNAITAADDRTHTNNTKHYSNKYFVKSEMKNVANSDDGRMDEGWANITYVGTLPERINTDLNGVRKIKDCISGNTVNTENHWVEIQAISNGVNVALNKPVTGTSPEANNTTYAYDYIVDGKIDNVESTSGFGYTSSVGLQCVTIDLGDAYNLDEIAVWHPYSDKRTYNGNITYVSTDGLLWKKVIDKNEAESDLGKRVTAWDEPLEQDEEEQNIIMYTGDVQVYTVPESGYYHIEAWGADGYGVSSGLGGYSSGYINLNQGEKLYIYVGGEGRTGAGTNSYSGPIGGYNGGGDGGNSTSTSGGGATDIRYFGSTTPTTEDLEWNSTLGLNSRILVAGGGGGSDDGYTSTTNDGRGGAGGGIQSKGAWVASSYNDSYKATQISGGSFGIGQSVTTNTDTGGAGGGYYGGKVTNNNNGGSGGGSSFISGFAGVNAITASDDRTHTNNTMHYSNKYFIKGSMLTGENSGYGKARITYVENAPTRTNTDINNVRYIKDCINGSSANAGNHWVEIQAIYNGNNIALGKTVTGTSPEYSATEVYTKIVDGLTDADSYGGSANQGMQCVTVDLASTYNLDEIAVWHHYADARTYNDNVTYVSADNFSWKKAISKVEAESSMGKRVSAWDTPLPDNDSIIMYTGDVQTYTVPISGYYKLETWGAQGGGAAGGKGGHSSGYINLEAGEKLYVYVGQPGSTITNIKTFNGGTSNSGGYNGGGSTDIRYFGNATPSSSDLEWDSTIGINSRIMVAGGGGSASGGTGGAGGTLIGKNGGGTAAGTQTTFGGVQSSSYTVSSFGIANGGCSGGNGYYPGGGATCANGAGGGSSFISGYAGVNAITAADDRTHTNNTKHYSNKYFIKGAMESDINSNYGKAKIEYIGETLTRTNPDLNNVRYIKDCISGSTANTGNHWVELQAIKNGVNIALNKSITGTSPEINSTTNAYANIVDGRIENTTGNSGYGSTNATGLQCITVDLETVYDLDEVAVWHYFTDGRTYYYNTVYGSMDNLHWKRMIDRYEPETSNGKHVSAWDTPLPDNESVIMNTSDTQEFTAPQSGYYFVEAWGAKGGDASTKNGGNGSYTSGYIHLNQNDKIYVSVGEKGNSAKNSTATTPFNGGGLGITTSTNDTAGSGGGATDIRIARDTYVYTDITNNGSVYYGPYWKTTKGYYQIDIYGNNLNNCTYSLYDNNNGGTRINYTISGQVKTSSHVTLLANINVDATVSGLEVSISSVSNCTVTKETFSRLEDRIMVAGGGGGAYYHTSYYSNGANGGDLVANPLPVDLCSGRTYVMGSGASQRIGGSSNQCGAVTTNGMFAIGGSGSSWSSGGGGGYYGGGAGYAAGAGGGSSFVSGFAGANAITAADDVTNSDNTIHYSNKHFINSTMTPGANSGNGKAKITYYGANEPTRVNSDLLGVRYIKDCVNGSTAGDDAIWIELQAIKNGLNLAKGKTVTGTSPAIDSTLNYANITDGRVDNVTTDSGYGKAKKGGLQCISIDLGSEYNLDEIAVWHYYLDSRIFYENATYVSADSESWTEINSTTEVETSLGKRITAWKPGGITHYVNVQYNINGGELASKHGENISVNNDGIIMDGDSTILTRIPYVAARDLVNWNDNKYINIKKNKYILGFSEEWNTEPDASGTSFDQVTQYSGAEFCDASEHDCTITLYANWRVPPSEPTEFSYTGAVQTYTIPIAGYYKLEAYAGSGASASIGGSSAGGAAGGYAYGTFLFKSGEELKVYVGRAGSGTSGGWNGGGNGGSGGGGGGGATDFRYNGTAYANRILVAGGGGGAGCGEFNGWHCYTAGAGGNETGGTGPNRQQCYENLGCVTFNSGTAATQTGGNAVGTGFNGTYGGGGGGGYYGGGNRNGGSSFISGYSAAGCKTAQDKVSIASGWTRGARSGNGSAAITYCGDSACE